MRVTFNVNGTQCDVDNVGTDESLLRMLRDRMGLYGSKNACEQGECGSCSVLVDGTLACSCLIAAGQVNGRTVTTIEGVSGDEPGDCDHVQRAFVDAGAVQCGFCTPGLIVTVRDLLSRDSSPDDATIREALAGNLCRCTGYTKIIDAVQLAAARRNAAASGNTEGAR